MHPHLKNAGRTNPVIFVATIGLVLIGLVWLALKAGIGNYGLDDAYIVEHSVQGILAGHESRYVDSSPWDGVTSPAYVAGVALFSLLAPIDVAHWIVSTLSTLLLACGWFYLCRRRSLGGLLTVVTVLTSLLAGKTFYHLANGLETGMAMAAFTWTLIALDYDEPPIWAYVLVGIQYFIRPELAALSLIFMLCVAIRRPAGWLKGGLIALCSFFIPALAMFIASGAVVPNTLSAKVYFFAVRCMDSALKLHIVALGVGHFLAGFGLFAAGFILAALSKQRLVIFSFVAVFLFAYFERFPSALWDLEYRYSYLLMPVAVIGWVAGLGHKYRLIRVVSTTFGAAAVAWVLYCVGSSYRSYVDGVRKFERANAATADWVASHLPQEAVVMIHDAGRISLVGKQPLVDFVGLKSSYSMKVHKTTTYQQCQRVPMAVSDIARHAHVSYVVVAADWDKIFGLTESLRVTGWSVERADTERGDSFYKVYKITDRGNGERSEKPIQG